MLRKCRISTNMSNAQMVGAAKENDLWLISERVVGTMRRFLLDLGDLGEMYVSNKKNMLLEL